jgi:hypothetical protein
MASLYKRGRILWISYRAADGQWKCKSTGYRAENRNERGAAQKLCDRQSVRERTQEPARSTDWDWVLSWMDNRFGESATAVVYRKCWHALHKWLIELDIGGPGQLRREQCESYPAWRAEHGGRRNTAIMDLRFLAQICEEAVRRGYIERNPARKLGIRKDPTPGHPTWTDDELARVDAHLAEHERYGWLRVTFLLGRYQAARLGQCSVPLSDIDLNNRPQTIWYAAPKGGSKKAYRQDLDERLIPALREIIAERKRIGAQTLCDLPERASLVWRELLDRLGYPHLIHHSLRATWVTQAAIKGIPEGAAKTFSNHSSTAVHRIYQRYSPSDMSAFLKRLQQ